MEYLQKANKYKTVIGTKSGQLAIRQIIMLLYVRLSCVEFLRMILKGALSSGPFIFTCEQASFIHRTVITDSLVINRYEIFLLPTFL